MSSRYGYDLDVLERRVWPLIRWASRLQWDSHGLWCNLRHIGSKISNVCITCAGSNHWSTTVTGVLFQVCIIVIGHSQIAYIHVLLLMPIDHKGRLLLFHSWCLWNDPEMMAALGDDDIKKSLYLISSKIESYCDPDCYHDVGCKKLLGGWGEASPWPSQRKGSDYAGIGWI